MTEEEWLAAARAMAAIAVVHPTEPMFEARRMLLDAYMLTSKAPSDALLRFSAAPEQLIAELAKTKLSCFHHGDFSLRVDARASLDDVLLLLVGHIRGLDEFLSETATNYGSIADVDAAWLIETESHAGYLIPRTVPRRPSSAPKSRDDLGAFIHRTLRWHRILPTELGGYRVRLFPVEADVGRADGELILGPGLFADLDLDCSDHETKDRFRVGAVICPDLPDQVGSHLERGHLEKCAVLSFPELTIDPSQREVIARALKARPWAAKPSGSLWTVPIVVAGSWHEQDGQAWFNVATVMDGYGRTIAQHQKLFPYVDPDGRLEDISSGRSISVLVSEDSLLAIGICRDFCERGGPTANPYSLLDADLFLITSYGDERTMAGHFATAIDVQIRFRSEVFVVQQAPKGTADALGYVLSPEAAGNIDMSELKRTERWKTVKIILAKG